MKSGYVAPKGNFEKEKRIRAARLKSELSTPPRMARIPAAMMEPEARGVEVMHRFYSRATKGGEGNWGETVLDTSLSFRLDWVRKVSLRPTNAGPAQTKLHQEETHGPHQTTERSAGLPGGFRDEARLRAEL